MRLLLPILLAATLPAAERAVDPTFLRTSLPRPTGAACQVTPIFGAGTAHASIARGVARFTHVALAANSRCPAATLAAREEQSWFVLRGAGTLQVNGAQHPLRADDFLYLPAAARYEIAATSGPLELVQFGYKIPAGATGATTFQIANAGDVKKQTVGNHPPSTLYQLLIGDTRSTRDRIAAGAVLTSLFLMEITPEGTNFPHHHDREEEIYLLLDGSGEMVAGSGADGVEGKFPASAGAAYFYRLNTTVGFYNTGKTKARILAARSLYPFPTPKP